MRKIFDKLLSPLSSIRSRQLSHYNKYKTKILPASPPCLPLVPHLISSRLVLMRYWTGDLRCQLYPYDHRRSTRLGRRYICKSYKYRVLRIPQEIQLVMLRTWFSFSLVPTLTTDATGCRGTCEFVSCIVGPTNLVVNLEIRQHASTAEKGDRLR